MAWRTQSKNKKEPANWLFFITKMAEPTGFEPATSDVTGRRSNQLNYDSALKLKCLFNLLLKPCKLGGRYWVRTSGPPVCQPPASRQR
jgi:hypothetical protein